MVSRFFQDWREMLGEQVEYHELLFEMTKRDLLLRYKQTVMGFGWAIFTPVVNTIVFSVIFMRVAPIDVGVPYPLFVYLGLLAWNFSASSLRFSVNSLTSNTSLVTKVYFPRELFPFTAVVVSVADFAVASVILAGLMVYYHAGVSWTVLFVPVILIVQIVFTCAVALILAMANLFYRDVKYLFEVVITLWMFATSVLYPTEMVGGKLGVLLRINPMTSVIDAYRATVLHGHPPPVGFWVVGAVSLVLLNFAWLIFHRAEFKFAENV